MICQGSQLIFVEIDKLPAASTMFVLCPWAVLYLIFFEAQINGLITLLKPTFHEEVSKEETSLH